MGDFFSFLPQHHPHPTRQIQHQLLIRIGRIAQAGIDAFKAPKYGSIGMQDHLVTSFTWYRDRKPFVGVAWMKGKHKNQVATVVGEHLFSGLQIQLLGGTRRKQLVFCCVYTQLLVMGSYYDISLNNKQPPRKTAASQQNNVLKPVGYE